MSVSKELFIDDKPIVDHINALNKNTTNYLATLMVLLKHNIDLTMNTKAKIIASSLYCKKKELCIILFEHEQFNLAEILKACEILDSKRYINQLTKKIEKTKTVKIKKKRYIKLKSELEKAQAINEGLKASLNKSKIKFIVKNWVNKISKDKLEFYAMTYSLVHWKRLANYLHLKPSDYQLDWFLSYTFTNESPEGCILSRCKTINDSNCKEIIEKYKPSYNYLRTLKAECKFSLTNELKELIANYTSLDIVVWWHEELGNYNVDKSVIDRLDKGEPLNLPYGKLMERLMNMKARKATSLYNRILQIAENKLAKYKVHLEQPIVVLGDASSSMEVAIKTSNIIASVLCAVCKAELHLFRDTDEYIAEPPHNAHRAIELSQKHQASGRTAPAASLYPYYVTKKIIKTFIIVTDEEENTEFNGYFFAQLFKLYRKHVYPSKLVFVSFIKDDNVSYMTKSLKLEIPDIDKDIIQFKLDPNRPDLTKLDSILGSIAVLSNKFNEEVKDMHDKINTNYLANKSN